MKKIIADIHTHTIASGHAYGTIREMARAAAYKHLKFIGFSEHAPGIPGTVDPFYYCNLKVIPRVINGVGILHGCEINVLNDGTLSLEERWISRLDYGIAGIHTLCYEDEGREKNTDNLISCMRHEKIFFVSHPDDDHTPINYERFIAAAKEFHVAPEINNSSLLKPDRRLNCVENYKTMLKLCMEQRVPVVVSSDAHDPSGVGNFKLALDFLKAVDFDEELIVNNDVDKLLSFIGMTPEQALLPPL